jgi:hypothetical protein
LDALTSIPLQHGGAVDFKRVAANDDEFGFNALRAVDLFRVSISFTSVGFEVGK